MTACSSGATAIGLGRDLIRTGAARVMIAGGTEPLCRLTFASFNALQAVDPDYCRPFSENRAGLTLGEAAGVLVIESEASALERGAPVLGEILGYGVTCDSHHMTAPDVGASGAARRCGRRSPTRAWRRRRWTTSTPTARRRRSTT